VRNGKWMSLSTGRPVRESKTGGRALRLEVQAGLVHTLSLIWIGRHLAHRALPPDFWRREVNTPPVMVVAGGLVSAAGSAPCRESARHRKPLSPIFEQLGWEPFGHCDFGAHLSAPGPRAAKVCVSFPHAVLEGTMIVQFSDSASVRL